MKNNHEKHEVIDFIRKYLTEEFFVEGSFKRDEVELIQSIICNAKYIENFRPDGFSIINDDIYPIEHFQFDASIEKKGSQLSKEEALVDKKVNELNKTFSFQIDTKSEKGAYIFNLIHHFEEHAKKVNDYKNNISEEFPDKKIKDMVFFIEDKTIFGAVYQDMKPFDIIQTKEFSDVWKKYPEVKYIFLAGTCLNKKYCKVCKIDNLKDNYRSINDCGIIIMNSAHGINVTEEIKWKK